jgi:hypothetical protein
MTQLGVVDEGVELDDKVGKPVEPTASPIQRAFRSIEALADQSLTASDLARVLGVNRSTALRLLVETVAYRLRRPRRGDEAVCHRLDEVLRPDRHARAAC